MHKLQEGGKQPHKIRSGKAIIIVVLLSNLFIYLDYSLIDYAMSSIPPTKIPSAGSKVPTGGTIATIPDPALTGSWSKIKRIAYRFLPQTQATSDSKNMHNALNDVHLDEMVNPTSNISDLFEDSSQTQLKPDAVDTLKQKIEEGVASTAVDSTDKNDVKNKVRALPLRWKGKTGSPVMIRGSDKLAKVMTSFVTEGAIPENKVYQGVDDDCFFICLDFQAWCFRPTESGVYSVTNFDDIQVGNPFPALPASASTIDPNVLANAMATLLLGGNGGSIGAATSGTSTGKGAGTAPATSSSGPTPAATGKPGNPLHSFQNAIIQQNMNSYQNIQISAAPPDVRKRYHARQNPDAIISLDDMQPYKNPFTNNQKCKYCVWPDLNNIFAITGDMFGFFPQSSSKVKDMFIKRFPKCSNISWTISLPSRLSTTMCLQKGQGTWILDILHCKIGCKIRQWCWNIFQEFSTQVMISLNL